MSVPFVDDVSAFADVGWPCVEVWLTKLEKHLETHSFESVQTLFTQKNIAPMAAAYQGGLLIAQGEQRQTNFTHYRRRLELCQALGIPLLLIAADYALSVDHTSMQRAAVSLKQAAQWAAGFDVKLGLEFRGGPAICTNLDTAISLVEEVREPNVGVCLDVFHFYKGPSKADDLARLTASNLAHVQLCDVAGLPRELMAESDRILPGEGDFQLAPIIDTLNRINYEGCISLEVMNPVLWEMKLTQVAELGRMAMQRWISWR